jgi:SAM-dependent methyltransferase
MPVSVIIPVYRNAATLAELHRRVRGTLAEAHLIFINDASPDPSAQVLQELARQDARVTAVQLEFNVGQNRAVLEGLRRAGGAAVSLDADLQDPPEAIPALLAKLDEGFDAVFAGRRGGYEPAPRLIASRWFKRGLSRLAGAPLDAGLFVALSPRMVDRLLEFPQPGPVVAMIGCTGLPMTSIPVERAPRPHGKSSYSEWDRVRLACQALLWARRWRHRNPQEHNRAQRAYFEQTEKPRMVPGDTPYLRRHLEEILQTARLSPGARVLEAGCGMGRYTLLLARRGIQIEGLDPSPVLLDRLRSYSSAEREIPLHCAVLEDPPAALAGAFDAVLGFFTLHHVANLTAFFRGAARVLQPGGRTVFLEPNAYNPLYYAQILLTPGMTWQGDRGVVDMRRSVVFAAMQSAGFRRLTLRRFGFFPPFLTNRPGGRALEAVLERFPLWRGALPFQLFCGELPA